MGFTRGATNVYGLYLKETKEGLDLTTLYMRRKNGDLEKVDAVDKKTRMANFVDWLNGFDKAIVLAVYNNHNYDDFVLAHNLLEAGVDVEELKMMSDYARFVPRLNSTVASRLFLTLFSFLCNSFDYFCFVCRGQRQQQG